MDRTTRYLVVFCVLSASPSFGQVSYGPTGAFQTSWGPLRIRTVAGLSATVTFDRAASTSLVLGFVGPAGNAPGNVVELAPGGGSTPVGESWFYERAYTAVPQGGLLIDDDFANSGLPNPRYLYGHGMLVDTQPRASVPGGRGHWRHVQLVDQQLTTPGGNVFQTDDNVDVGLFTLPPTLPSLEPRMENVGGNTNEYYAGNFDLPGFDLDFGLPSSGGQNPLFTISDVLFETWVVRVGGPAFGVNAGAGVQAGGGQLARQPFVAGSWRWDYRIALILQPGVQPSGTTVLHTRGPSARSATPGGATYATTLRPNSGPPTGPLLHYRTHVRAYFGIAANGPWAVGTVNHEDLFQYVKITEPRWR